MANQSVIVVGITLALQKVVAAIHIIATYETIMGLFTFGRQPNNRQTTKLKLLSNKIMYIYAVCVCVCIQQQLKVCIIDSTVYDWININLHITGAPAINGHFLPFSNYHRSGD